MQYRTHFTTSLAVSLPIMVATNSFSFGSIAALSLGAVFPDIDEPHSWIGSRTRGISDIIKGVFGHRGITHSIVGLILAFLTIILMTTILNINIITGLFFVLGYGLHLIEDSFSKSGVKWLIPLTDQKFQSGMGIFYYTTGGMVENFILLGSVLILLLEIKSLDFSGVHLIDLPNINIISLLSNAITKFKGLTNL